MSTTSSRTTEQLLEQQITKTEKYLNERFSSQLDTFKSNIERTPTQKDYDFIKVHATMFNQIEKINKDFKSLTVKQQLNVNYDEKKPPEKSIELESKLKSLKQVLLLSEGQIVKLLENQTKKLNIDFDSFFEEFKQTKKELENKRIENIERNKEITDELKILNKLIEEENKKLTENNRQPQSEHMTNLLTKKQQLETDLQNVIRKSGELVDGLKQVEKNNLIAYHEATIKKTLNQKNSEEQFNILCNCTIVNSATFNTIFANCDHFYTDFFRPLSAETPFPPYITAKNLNALLQNGYIDDEIIKAILLRPDALVKILANNKSSDLPNIERILLKAYSNLIENQLVDFRSEYQEKKTISDPIAYQKQQLEQRKQFKEKFKLFLTPNNVEKSLKLIDDEIKKFDEVKASVFNKEVLESIKNAKLELTSEAMVSIKKDIESFNKHRYTELNKACLDIVPKLNAAKGTVAEPEFQKQKNELFEARKFAKVDYDALAKKLKESSEKIDQYEKLTRFVNFASAEEGNMDAHRKMLTDLKKETVNLISEDPEFKDSLEKAGYKTEDLSKKDPTQLSKSEERKLLYSQFTQSSPNTNPLDEPYRSNTDSQSTDTMAKASNPTKMKKPWRTIPPNRERTNSATIGTRSTQNDITSESPTDVFASTAPSENIHKSSSQRFTSSVPTNLDNRSTTPPEIFNTSSSSENLRNSNRSVYSSSPKLPEPTSQSPEDVFKSLSTENLRSSPKTISPPLSNSPSSAGLNGAWKSNSNTKWETQASLNANLDSGSPSPKSSINTHIVSRPPSPTPVTQTIVSGPSTPEETISTPSPIRRP